MVAQVGSEATDEDDDEIIQQQLEIILLEHSGDPIKIWGNSEQWVLELRDGRRVEGEICRLA